jgi:uncharacterized protein
MRRWLLSCLLLALAPAEAFAAASGPVASAELAGFKSSVLEVRGKSSRHWFNVYLALTANQQQRGLMFVRQLPNDTGMLFVLDQPRPMSMWMKNTYIPLDMLFIDTAGRVSCIRADTVPHSEAIVGCEHPVKAVLEINAGQAKKRGINVGDNVVHPLVKRADN